MSTSVNDRLRETVTPRAEPTSLGRRNLGAGAFVCSLVVWLAAGTAQAGVPATSLIDGVLLSSGGSAAADGDYDMTFSFYEASSGGSAAWTETSKVKVAGGRFSHPAGSATPLDSAKLMPLKEIWLGIKVASDPELPRQKMHSGLFALVAAEAAKLSCMGCLGSDHFANGSVAAGKVGFNFAGSATKGGPAVDVECSGCVNVSDVKFDGDVDLAGNSLKAKNGTFSGTVAAAEFVGDGSKLTGLKTPAGECKVAGEVVKGINADGTLKCVAALDPSALPNDGLNEISTNLLSNQFVDTIEGQKDVAIPDNTGSDANSVLTFADIGTTQDFELTVDISNTDLSTLSLTVLPPDDKKTGWVLCDPCGKKDVKTYQVTFNSKNLPKSGDLMKWIGANPKGTWNLKALDTSYCIPQQQGNSGICNVANGTDGKIISWNIKIQTLSNKKIGINGDTYQSGKAWLKDVDIAGTLSVKTLTIDGSVYQGMFPEGSRPFLYGWIEDHTQGNWVYQPVYQYAHNIPLDNASLHRAMQEIRWGDNFGNWEVGHGGVNYGNGNEEYARQYTAAFIKNTTSSDVVRQICFRWSSHPNANGNYASLAINGNNVWSYTDNNLSTHCQNVTFPKSQTSVLVLKTGSYMWTTWNGYYNKTVIGFYNDSFKLAGTGLAWDYERYNNWLANK